MDQQRNSFAYNYDVAHALSLILVLASRSGVTALGCLGWQNTLWLHHIRLFVCCEWNPAKWHLVLLFNAVFLCPSTLSVSFYVYIMGLKKKSVYLFACSCNVDVLCLSHAIFFHKGPPKHAHVQKPTPRYILSHPYKMWFLKQISCCLNACVQACVCMFVLVFPTYIGDFWKWWNLVITTSKGLG